MSAPPELNCPACSARLVVPASTEPVILCGGCGVQFRPSGDWPVKRTSRRAIASFILGILSPSGLTAIPALFLGLWALRDMRHPRNAEILSGKRLATTGASLGGFFSFVMLVLPLLILIPLRRGLMIETLRRSARTHVADQRWTEAAAEYRQIIELDPNNELNWLRAAPLHALSDEEAYRQLCDQMLSQLGESEDPKVAERIAKACLLLPPSKPHLTDASRLAEQAATQDPNHELMLWFHVTRALARYRRGDAAGAIQSCEACRSGDPEDRVWKRAALMYFVQAGAHSQLGASEDAKRTLDRGRALLKSHPDLGSSWHDQLIAKLLKHEVERLVASADRDTTER